MALFGAAEHPEVERRELGDHAELLLTMAEVSVAFAGFASITVLFRGRSAGDWAFADVLRYGAMLRASLFACLFSLLPVVLFHAGASESWTWSVTSVGLLAYGATRSHIFALLLRVGARPSVEIVRNAIALGLIVAFQLLNLLGLGFHREAAPVLLGVGLLLANAGANFYRLVVVEPSVTGSANRPEDSSRKSG